MRNVASAVFADRDDAERAVDGLRDEGVPDHAISIVIRDTGMKSDDVADRGDDSATDAGKGALTGAAVGAAVGAVFGLAAAAIPGVGPFITAGALANVLGTTGGATAAGALVGGTSGGLAAAISGWGVNEGDARYYAGEVVRGGTWVGIDLSQTTVDAAAVNDAFARFNGRFTQRMAA